VGAQATTLRAAIARRYERRQSAKENFTEFARTIGVNAQGERLSIVPMHVAWHQHVNYCWSNGLHAGVMAHFGSGKSSSFAVPLVSWLLGRNPNMRTIIVSNDDRSAQARVGLIGRYMTELPGYKQIFPDIRKGDKWSDTELTVARTGMSQDPSLLARGVRSTGIGTHADIVIFDDPVDQKNSRQQAVRIEIRDLIEQTWLSRLDPGGRALYIGTAWHKEDTTHYLMQNPGWSFLVQRVNEACTEITQEVFGRVGSDYPLLASNGWRG
jgi:hypothetical protein